MIVLLTSFKIKDCASKISKVLDPVNHTIKPGITNRVFMGHLKVNYFKIPTLGKQAPLTVKIIQDESTNRKNAATVYTSFKTDYPDTENNDGKYDIGRIKIFPNNGKKQFNSDH